MSTAPRKPQAAKSADLIAVTFSGAKNAAESLFDATAEKTYAQAREQMAQAAKVAEAANAFGRENLNAALASGNALVAGAQEIGRAWLAMMQGALDDGLGASRRLAACRTTKDMIDAHGEIAAASYRKFAGESRKLSEISARVAGDVSAPLVGRVDAAIEALSKPIAA